MAPNGSPRAGRRRLLLTAARIGALLILVTGINGIIESRVPRYSPLYLYAAAVAVGLIPYFAGRRGKPQAAPLIAEPEAMPIPEPITASLDVQPLHEEIRQLEQARADLEERTAALAHDVQELTEVNHALRGQISEIQAAGGEQLRQLNAELVKAHAAAEEESGRRRVDAEDVRGREAHLRDQYEAESDHLQKAASSALEEIQRTRAANEEIRGQLEQARQAMRQSSDSLSADAAQERVRREALERELQEVRHRAEQRIAEVRTELEREWNARLDAARETNATLHRQLEDDRQRFQTELDTQKERTLSEARTIAARADDLQRWLDEERQRFQTELESHRAHLQKMGADQEATLAQAARAREESGAVARALEQQIEEERRRFAAAAEAHQAQIKSTSSETESQLADALAAREEARAELRSVHRHLDQMQHQIDEERQRFHGELALQKSKMDDEWSAKLQKIVNELATDHEKDVGDAVLEREVARAEARHLTIRLQELQRRVEEKQAPANETELREKIDAEWSAKLQTIVAHLASDHEADIGKAIEEKEAARAEARNLGIRITQLQQRMENERQASAAAQEKGNAMRDSLAEKLQEAEEGLARLHSAPPPPRVEEEPLPTETSPFAPADEERARADVLEFAEQAHAVLRKITSPGTVPVPELPEVPAVPEAPEERRPLVLFVHHDPALRTMSRDHLFNHGFEVITAADGLEGLRLAMSRKPDIVVADASMPKMDGRELCQLIKSNQETAAVKVVLMTGLYTSEMARDSAADAFEPDELLRKPVKFDTLQSTLSNLLKTA
jgi:CheY-like chemotaxis protein